jgi:hypothetical protein
LGQVKLLEKLTGRRSSVFMPLVKAARRRAAEAKRPVKKAGEVPADVLKWLVSQHVQLAWDGLEAVDRLKLRTI